MIRISPSLVSVRPAPSRLLACLALASLFAGFNASLSAARQQDDSEIVSIFARTSDDYQRTKLPDGSLQPEAYAFGDGGLWTPVMQDDSLEKMDFKNIARTVALPLAEQGYLPTKDPNQTKLLIMVYWGMTENTSGASTTMAYGALQSRQAMQAVPVKPPPPPPKVSNGAVGLNQSGTTSNNRLLSERVQAMTLITMENNLRDRSNQQKASILGYEVDLDRTGGAVYSPTHFLRDRLIDELEDNRYFVVLLAYDFQKLWKEKKTKLVWETRFSIRERGNRFDEQLASMAQSASNYFGKKTDGLKRHDIPRGKVEMDDVKILSAESRPASPAKP